MHGAVIGPSRFGELRQVELVRTVADAAIDPDAISFGDALCEGGHLYPGSFGDEPEVFGADRHRDIIAVKPGGDFAVIVYAAEISPCKLTVSPSSKVLLDLLRRAF